MQDLIKVQRDGSRCTITADNLEHEFVFRIPQTKDWLLLRSELPAEMLPGGKFMFDAENTDHLMLMFALGDEMLLRCSIHPKLTEENLLENPPGVFPIDELPSELRAEMATRLLSEGGYTKGDAADLGNSSSAAGSFDDATSSGADTDAGRVSSSG
ncbi:MAG: hypothetical protein GY715_14265 [Planctomycetes bacterium]|nr:hypothetical protein [Planctomycetota bacterium]